MKGQKLGIPVLDQLDFIHFFGDSKMQSNT